MSANERTPFDAPGASDDTQPVALELAVDPDWSGGKGEACVYNPDAMGSEWIEASIEDFVEVEHNR